MLIGSRGCGVALLDAVTFLLEVLTVVVLVRAALEDMTKEKTPGRECLTSSFRWSFRREEGYVDCVPCMLLYRESIILYMHVCISRTLSF